jgi:hypothetical protein
MNCPHATPMTREINRCALGLYGGKPSKGVCGRCMRQGQNNSEYAAALFARADRTHPAHRPRLSGCCDRADQA